MATLQDINLRITAVKKTKQITRAMNMVAAAKLRSNQARIENFRPYAAKFSDLMANLAAGIAPEIHPFLIQPDEVKKIRLAAFSSDRGLCGGFNTNIINGVESVIRDKKDQDIETSLTMVGRKVNDNFKRKKADIASAYTGVMNAYDYTVASKIAGDLSESFITGEVDEVWIFYTRFENVSRLRPTLVKLLPVSPAEEEDNASGTTDAIEYLVEPNAEAIMIDLLPRSFTIQIYNAMLETSASEEAARMIAMDNATTNCADLVDSLTMAYNKARQAAITMELLDIVGGAEALKG